MTVPIADALDGANYVVVDDDAGIWPVVAVWHGGASVNFYQAVGEEWHEVTQFSVTDEDGGLPSPDHVAAVIPQLIEEEISS